MFYFSLPAALKDIPEPDKVGVNVSVRVLDGIPHARLGGEVHDGVEGIFSE